MLFRSDFEYILLNNKEQLFNVLKSIPKDSIISFDTETTSLDSSSAKIVGFSFCFDSTKAYYVPIAHVYLGVPHQIGLDDAKMAITILASQKVVFQNFKYDYEVIKNNFSIQMPLYADTMIMGWLYNPGQSVSLDSMAEEFFNHKMIAYGDVVGKNETFADIDVVEACKYAAEDALMTYKLYFKLKELLQKRDVGLLKLAQDLEFPFIYVLLEMEQNGIKVDIDFLKQLEGRFNDRLKELTNSIYQSAGCEFNINSTKQIGRASCRERV